MNLSQSLSQKIDQVGGIHTLLSVIGRSLIAGRAVDISADDFEG